MLRYDEDFRYVRDRSNRSDLWDPIKYVPLNDVGDWYVTIGGEIRHQYEFYNNPDFGLAPEDDDGYLLQRYMLHADLHVGRSFRLFGQLKSNFASFQDGLPGPADEDRLDVHQAFLDVRAEDAHGTVRSATLRVGRQEMLYGSQRLVGVREGPNVRRTFDAVRLLTEFGRWRVDGFVSRPVETDPGTFDDWGEDDSTFWGVYATGSAGDATGANIDLYYLGLDRSDATFDQGTADELRHSVGMRFFGKANALDYNFEAVYQFGRFGAGDIVAWTVASDTGYTFHALPMKPRIALRANVISGDDDPADGDLGTFNPLFPRGNYFGESALIGPLNLVNVHPIVQLHLSDTVSLEAGWDFFWRYSTDDGIYGNGVNLVQSAAGSGERYIGSELSFLLEWQIDRHLSLAVSYSHFFAGSFLQETGPGEDVAYYAFLLAYRF